jgi:hypothetical protein
LLKTHPTSTWIQEEDATYCCSRSLKHEPVSFYKHVDQPAISSYSIPPCRHPLDRTTSLTDVISLVPIPRSSWIVQKIDGKYEDVDIYTPPPERIKLQKDRHVFFSFLMKSSTLCHFEVQKCKCTVGPSPTNEFVDYTAFTESQWNTLYAHLLENRRSANIPMYRSSSAELSMADL